jgi:hypothetical protein
MFCILSFEPSEFSRKVFEYYRAGYRNMKIWKCQYLIASPTTLAADLRVIYSRPVPGWPARCYLIGCDHQNEKSELVQRKS